MWAKICMIAIGTFALSCKPISNTTSCSVKETALHTLHIPTIEFNSSKEFALCYNSNPNEITGRIEFLIIKTSNCSILERGSLMPGYIKWVSEDKIEVLDLPGTLEGDKDLVNFKKIISIKALNPK
jgi:hypothetical protein